MPRATCTPRHLRFVHRSNGPFSVAPCQTIVLRFATFSQLVRWRLDCGGGRLASGLAQDPTLDFDLENIADKGSRSSAFQAATQVTCPNSPPQQQWESGSASSVNWVCVGVNPGSVSACLI